MIDEVFVCNCDKGFEFRNEYSNITNYQICDGKF